MKIMSFNPLLIRFLLFFYMLVSMVSLHNHLVLCYEMNGDITLEWTQFGVCDDQADRGFSGVEGHGSFLNDVPDHCGACVDEPLSIGLSQRVAASFSKVYFHVSALSLSGYAYTTEEPSLFLKGASHAPNTAFPVPAALRTVVLLI